MPRMRVPWSKPEPQQMDLLGESAAPIAVGGQPPAPVSRARPPSMVATSSLYEDPQNPRTEIPDADIEELAEDIEQHGILQPIVVHPADGQGRYRIHFGCKRWLAAQRCGLREVPVVVRDGLANPYAQVSENQKRHGLTPLDLARFIRRRIDAGDSNSAVAKGLGLDLTTVAHHLALLDLPPVLDAALQAGRCTSPRTLYELSKLHAEQPERVAALVTGIDPITREAVAELRDAAPAVPAVKSLQPKAPPPNRAAQAFARAGSLCSKLDAALVRLGQVELGTLPAVELTSLRQRLDRLASRINA